MPKLLFLVTEDWYFVSHRLPLAIAARAQGFDVAVLTRASKHRKRIEEAGIRVIPFKMNRRGLNPLGILREALALACIYRREKPDLVHHVALRPVVVGGLAARIAGVRRVVAAVTGMGFLFSADGREPWVAKLLHQVLPRLLSNGRVIVQNPEDQGLLVRFGVPNDNIRLIPGAGVDVEHFQPGVMPEGKPLVLLASRMLWDKGVGEFVAAARMLREQGRFVLVGPLDAANPAAVAEAEIHAWQQEGVAEWWGAREDMPEVLRQATIFCLPSSYREGMPKALLEAMAAGLACIATDAPGCRDAVEHGVSGLLIPLRDAGALTQALRLLLADAELRSRLGNAARQRVVQEFSSERIIRVTLGVYRELAS